MTSEGLEGSNSFEYAMSLLPAIFFVMSLVYIPNRLLSDCLFAQARLLPMSPPSKQRQSSSILVLGLVLLIVGYGMIELFDDNTGLHELIRGTENARLDAILERAPSLQRGPTPPLFFANRHLQFIPFLIQNEIHRSLQPIPFQRFDMEVTACADKSHFLPFDECEKSSDFNDTISLDIFPPFDHDSNDSAYDGFNQTSPIILFAPGLRCYSQDMPGNSIIRKAYEAGFRSVVVNRRGHTPGRKLQSPRWNLMGDFDDMEQVYWFVKNELSTGDESIPMFLHGISSGTAQVVSGIRQWDRIRRERRRSKRRTVPWFVASMTVSPGYDTSKLLNNDRFFFPYNDILTSAVKETFIKENEVLLREFNSKAVDHALSATNLQEFLDATAPFAGYPDASSYYKGENPVNELREIESPMLVLNAVDDPCCKIGNLYEKSPYPHHSGKTYAEMVRETKHGLVAVTKTGSHCAFMDGRWWPFTRDPLTRNLMVQIWADTVAIEYYLAALEVYSDRRLI